MQQIIEYVRENLALPESSKIDYVVCSGRGGESGAITLTFYSNGAPVVVGKLSREVEGAVIKREYKTLKNIRGLLKNTNIVKTIEKPISLIKINNNLILFKEFKKGVPGDNFISNSIFEKRRIKNSVILIQQSCNWIIEFLLETQEFHIKSKTDKEKISYELTGDTDLPDYFYYWIENKKFFSAPSHGDLVPSNILINNSEISGILDFENFTLSGLPIADLLGIIVDTGFILFGDNQKMIDKTFFKLNPFSEAVCNSILKFCESFKLTIEDFTQVMPIYSDRAISIAKRWNLDKLLVFHKKLKANLTARQGELILNRYL